MKNLLIPILTILGIVGNAQVKKIPMPIAADCKDAIRINFGKNKYASYGPTIAPVGFGHVQEIKGSNKKSCYGFEQEHNSAWYYFDVVSDGDLLLDIIPVDSFNDYDFILFKYTDSSFCDLMSKHQIKPIRSNISRSGKGGASATGLSCDGKSDLVHAGPGETFSKPMEVKKGERYYLVLDNVYPNGLGHTIKLGCQKIVQLKGVVLNEENKPVWAEVVLEDYQGKEIKKIQTDTAGKYSIEAALSLQHSYTLNFYNDSSFVNSKIIRPDLLEKADYKINNMKVILPKLKGGQKYSLAGINFYGNDTILLPISNSSINSLYKLMKKNRKMIIRIEGHINDPGHPSINSHKELSEQRAHAIFNILLMKGIEKDRMTTIGLGSQYMLFPRKNASDAEQEANRRVEINVISLE